ncbi:MAG: HpyAIV family type II restriction enzyme, partial [candidate division WOR-3 bacterium]
LISEFLKDWGFKILPKQIIPNPAKSKNKLVIDHYFTDGRTYYFIEQKIRDDHDSSKKRGQIDNFEAKLEYLYKNHQQNLVGIMYFIDPDLIKNKNYYDNELKKMKNIYGVELYLFYGKELFKFFNRGYDWDNLISWLTKWKMGLPDLPEINFDNDPESSFNDIKNLEISVWRKILENNRLWEEGIMLSIFKSGETLKMISEHYEKKQGKAYKKIAGMIKQKLQAYYKHQYSANNRVEVQD